VFRIKNELGTIKISSEVVTSIVGRCVNDFEELKLSNRSGSIAGLFGQKKLSRGVKVVINEDKVEIDLYITINYGSPFASLANRIQKTVTDDLEEMTGLIVSEVNIHIEDIDPPVDSQNKAEDN